MIDPDDRGTTYLDEGDPETPFYPSIPGAYRWTREKVEAGLADKHDLPGLPNIPIQPIGYGDALKFLKRMNGDEVPGNDFTIFQNVISLNCKKINHGRNMAWGYSGPGKQ